MAGRRQDFIYTADDGNKYAVNLDESNANNPALGFEKYTGTPKLNRQPTGLQLRKIVLKEIGGDIRRNIPCGTTTCQAWTGVVQSITLIDYNDLSDKAFEIIKTVQEFQSSPPRPYINY